LGTSKASTSSPDREVTTLRKRADQAARRSRAGVNLTFRIPVPVYKRLIEMAEEQHTSVNQIAKECLVVGTGKYRDFAGGAVRDPFVRTTPLRAYPDLSATEAGPRAGENSVAARVKARRFEASKQFLPPRDPEAPVPDDVSYLLDEALARIPAGALLPSTPPLLPPREEESTLPTENEESDGE
jgi:hypothetical protein